MRGLQASVLRTVALRTVWGAVLVLGMLASGPAPAKAQIQDTANSPIASAQVGLLRDLVVSAPTDAGPIVAALEALQADPDLSTATREKTFHDFALDLRDAADSTAGRAALTWLSGYESQILDPYEDRGPGVVPRWRVAGVARGTLTLWNRAAAVQSPSQQAAGVMDLASELARAERSGDAAALKQAMTGATTEQLAAGRAEMMAALERDAMHAPMVAEAALRLADPELSAAVLASGDKRAAVRLLAGIGASLPPDQAFPILRAGSEDAALASAAILQIGKTAETLPEARAFLLETLGDPVHGGSAAAALAGLEDEEAVFDVATALQRSGDEGFQRHAVLMLVLEGSPAASEALRDFVRRPDLSRDFRREVQDWLREMGQ